MPVSYQLVIDCRSPEPLALFWAAALHYVVAPPPSGFASWEAFYRSVGVPEELIGHGIDRIVDPGGGGPAIWFQVVPEKKVIKNRIHLDVNASGGPGLLESRPDQVEAEAARLEALGARRLHSTSQEGLDHLAIAMTDPEGNEFDIN
jgi:Glyoxalase-like domain